MSYDEQLDGDPHGECALEIATLTRQLAESQAQNAVLRGALKFYDNPENYTPMQSDHGHAGYRNGKIHDWDRGNTAKAVLALPQNDSALRELLRQECSSLTAQRDRLVEALKHYTDVVSSVNDPNDWTPKVKDEGHYARAILAEIEKEQVLSKAP